MSWDTDPGMELEALYDERLDADLEQAAWEREGRAVRAAQRAGRCTHGSAVGYRKPAYYPEQEGLRPGEHRCTAGCGEVFASDADWHRAITRAVHG